jgi:hypothetical protein
MTEHSTTSLSTSVHSHHHPAKRYDGSTKELSKRQNLIGGFSTIQIAKGAILQKVISKGSLAGAHVELKRIKLYANAVQ